MVAGKAISPNKYLWDNMASVYVVLASILFPVLAVCWLICIAACIYKGLVKSWDKEGRTTRVQVTQERLFLHYVVVTLVRLCHTGSCERPPQGRHFVHLDPVKARRQPLCAIA